MTEFIANQEILICFANTALREKREEMTFIQK